MIGSFWRSPSAAPTGHLPVTVLPVAGMPENAPGAQRWYVGAWFTPWSLHNGTTTSGTMPQKFDQVTIMRRRCPKRCDIDPRVAKSQPTTATRSTLQNSRLTARHLFDGAFDAAPALQRRLDQGQIPSQETARPFRDFGKIPIVFSVRTPAVSSRAPSLPTCRCRAAEQVRACPRPKNHEGLRLQGASDTARQCK
jgi:hypothetical protein